MPTSGQGVFDGELDSPLPNRSAMTMKYFDGSSAPPSATMCSMSVCCAL